MKKKGCWREKTLRPVRNVKPLDGTLNLATLEAQCQSAANVNVQYFIGRS